MHVSLKLFYWLWIDLQQHYAHKRCCKPASFSSVPFLSATPLLPCRLCTVAPTPKQHWTSATSTTPPPPTSPPSASYRPRCAAWTAATSHNSWTTWCPGISYILFIIIFFIIIIFTLKVSISYIFLYMCYFSTFYTPHFMYTLLVLFSPLHCVRHLLRSRTNLPIKKIL